MTTRKTILILLVALINFSGFSQTADLNFLFSDTISTSTDFFESDNPLFITLKFDVKSFQRNRNSEEYLPAVLTYQDGDLDSVTHDVRIKPRGDFRKGFCYLPPFWLNVKDAGMNYPDLESISKIKVVTQCKKPDIYGDYILKEYLIYKLYNIVSPYSFRVRLLQIKYIDTGRDNKESVNWAFAIEPHELLERRLDATFVKNDKLAMSTVNSGIINQLAIFQYMIGNSDYSVTGRHNLKIIRLNSSGPVGNIPIPYDFDYTGFVNASYALPGENLGIKTVTQRYFLGPCRAANVYQEVIDDFNSRKRDFLTLLQQFEYLTIKQKLEVLNYIESYYTESSSKRFIERNIESTCR